MLCVYRDFLRIMQARPCGQKKPSQQGRHLRVLDGRTFPLLRSNVLSSSALQLHPGSHPETHLAKLQFTLGFT